MEFAGKWDKTARWGSPFDITEKLDGTNAAVLIRTREGMTDPIPTSDGSNAYVWLDGVCYEVGAQSRTRVISPREDNYGFATWTLNNAHTLVKDLGPGTHYGEWWGSKIQRAYGYTDGERFFSLFDVDRYKELRWGDALTEGLDIVPILTEDDEFDCEHLADAEAYLRDYGSTVGKVAFDRPEGFVVRWKHNNMRLKYILDK